ncbi:MAG: SDR family oxidoreductase [Candidatus Omnitrophica bacterium]|nr:SDR family oxidoreductase [Candidatus Omnitrophota bacterium]
MKELKDLMDLKGRVALITGGAGHLGYAIAESLAELGAHIVLLDCDMRMIEKQKARLIKKYKVKVSSLCVDLEDEVAIKKVPSWIKKECHRLDILVNCAALVGTTKLEGWGVPFEKQNIDTWRRALEVNLTSIFVLTQACRGFLKKSKHGAVINISSTYGMVGPDMGLYEGTELGNPAAYAASKGGLIQLTRWLASNLAPDVRVNTISPGGIYRKHTDPFLSRYISRTFLKRMATEEDFKGAAAYLASDLSRYVTGHNLVVDGGWTAW